MTAPATSNLTLRLATAAIVLPLLVFVFLRLPAVYGVGLVALTLVLGLVEWNALARVGGVGSFPVVGGLLTLAFFTDLLLPRWPPLWPVGLVVLLVVALRVAEQAPLRAGLTLLGSAYLGVFGGMLAGLRMFDPGPAGGWCIILLLGIVMCADTMAFVVGRTWGRHPLFPRVSPKKTWEGAAGALLGGLIGALAFGHLSTLDLPCFHLIVLGVLTATLGILGDLFESLMKRWADLKDSGGLLPGHGGMLDRLDSLLLGAPVLYYYFHCIR